MTAISGISVLVIYKGVGVFVAPYSGRFWNLMGEELPVRISADSGQAHVSLSCGAVCAARLALLAIGITVPAGHLVHHLRGRHRNGIFDVAIIRTTTHAALESALKRRPERVGLAALRKLAAHPDVMRYLPRWKADRLRRRIRKLFNKT